MSLKKNIIANYVSQIYVTLIGILMLPIYIKYMGAEAYGLVGFFSMLQAMFNLLDLGLTPTISRETARFRAGSVNALNFLRLFRALSSIFLMIAVIGGSSLFFLSPSLAEDWLNAETLPLNDIQTVMQIMAVSVALRWMCGLYRGVITGTERLVWLGGFNVLISTLRFVVVLPVMWYFGFIPIVFFIYQFLIAVIEITGLWLESTRLLPKLESTSETIGWSLSPVRPVLKFSLTIAFTASVWVMVTQLDKLVLSSVLPLAEYGYFTLAVLVAGGILVIGGPVSSAIRPRMAKLEAEGNRKEVIRIYRQSTQLVTIIAGSAAVTLAFCAEPLLWAWTGDEVLSGKAAPILTLYAIGNGVLVIAAFPYYLQYARGNLKLHLIGNLLLLFFLIPSIVLSAIYYGAIGAGYAWVVVNSLYLLIWVAIIHRKLEPGLHLSWFFKDLLVIYVPIILLGFTLLLIKVDLSSRLIALAYVIVFGGCMLTLAVPMSTDARDFASKIKNKIMIKHIKNSVEL
ncbi:polysaccharide biosynthesis domain protein [hydrothermal vent metagenome]|uniref:Polysaccharide biosynthesis domain protein n=1 Tax=hydrothermal vent metagenome TaxID=652676 RepID=A0A3B0Z7R8_9ZZZZ